MLISIDGKIHHLRELEFIERMLFEEVFSPDDFYNSLRGWFESQQDLATKETFTAKDLDRLDNFVKNYFDGKIEEAKIWLLRSYIVGRFLAHSDIAGVPFTVGNVASLPKYVKDFAKEFGLTVEEAQALNIAIEEGAALMSNTTQSTMQTVRNTLVETLKRGGGKEDFYDRMREHSKKDIGELNRDWQRVAITETNSIFSNGYLAMLNEGDYVAGFSMPDACDSCLEHINGKVYRVRKDPAPDYTNMTGAEYQKWAEVWENEIWVGKNNFGRSSSMRKRINPFEGNKQENLREKHHHEFSMPAIPYHPYCRCRWVRINPEYQYVDKDDVIKLRVENEDAWQEWYENEIKR